MCMSKIMGMPIKFGVCTYVRKHVCDIWQLLNPEFLLMFILCCFFFQAIILLLYIFVNLMHGFRNIVNLIYILSSYSVSVNVDKDTTVQQ